MNRALCHGWLGPLPQPVDQMEQHYVYVLSLIAELVEGVAAHARSVMELEGRQLLEDALTELLSSAIHHILKFPAEYVIATDVPADQAWTFERARAFAKQFPESFARGEE